MKEEKKNPLLFFDVSKEGDSTIIKRPLVNFESGGTVSRIPNYTSEPTIDFDNDDGIPKSLEEPVKRIHERLSRNLELTTSSILIHGLFNSLSGEPLNIVNEDKLPPEIVDYEEVDEDIREDRLLPGETK